MLRQYRKLSEGTRTPFARLVRDYLGWRRSLAGSALKDRQPWMPFAARRQLARILSRGTTVFEYGAGGSTLWLADRVARVISVEHDPAWYEEMRDHVPS